MIKRSIITALVLVAAWHFLLPRMSSDYYWVPGQQRAHYLRAQKYIHDTPREPAVVVGSSMANELSQDILGPDWVKLTFPAGGSFTGLEIVSKTGKRPPFVLIESNTLLRGADEAMLQDVLSPLRRGLREASPIFKEEGRPSNYQVGFLNAWVGRFGNGIVKLMGGAKTAAAAPPADPSLMENVMRVNREHLDRVPAGKALATGMERMGELVDRLAAAGSQVVFFEMPIDPTLQHLAEPAAVRKAMVEHFPRDKYRWLDFDPRAYLTSDGIHLVPEESAGLTRKIVEEVK